MQSVLWPQSSPKRAPRPGQVPACPFSPLCQAGWASVTCGSSQDRHLLPKVPAPLCLSLAAPRKRCVDWWCVVHQPVTWLHARAMPRAHPHTPVLGTQELAVEANSGLPQGSKEKLQV